MKRFRVLFHVLCLETEFVLLFRFSSVSVQFCGRQDTDTVVLCLTLLSQLFR